MYPKFQSSSFFLYLFQSVLINLIYIEIISRKKEQKPRYVVNYWQRGTWSLGG